MNPTRRGLIPWTWMAAGIVAGASGVAAPSLVMASAVTTERADTSATADWRAAVESGELSDLLHSLDERARSAPLAADRIQARLRRARLQWQDGDREEALHDVNLAIADGEPREGLLLKAQLLDAGGEEEAAARLYASVLQQTGESVAHRRLAGRLALMGQDPVRALAASGIGEPADVAVVLALLGAPEAAVAVAPPQGGFEARVRLAAWSLDAQQYDRAASESLEAYAIAANEAERRYALSLLTQARRKQGRLDRIEADLEGQHASPARDEAHLDALLSQERFEAALTLLGGDRKPDARRRLIAVLEGAGLNQQAEAEYESLARSGPTEVEWVIGLAVHRLSRGDRVGALRAWSVFGAHNQAAPDRLAEAAEAMAAMGLEAEALAQMQAVMNRPAYATQARFWLLQAHIDRGQEDEALAVLDQLGSALGATDPDRVRLAEAYESLGRPADALAALSELEAAGAPLDYAQAVHRAQLEERLGLQGAAFDRWIALWTQTTLPTRRVFLERQVAASAQASGELEQLADRLSGRLTGPDASVALGLLLALRVAQNDRIGAEADLARYADLNALTEIDRLKRHAALQTRFADYRGLEATLRRLSEIDRPDADQHLRQLILALVARPMTADERAARLSAIDEALVQLQAVQRVGAEDEDVFAAGVYAQAGFPSQAVDRFRTAAARGGDIGLRVQWADQLARGGDGARAIQILQYSAEFAETDADFETAVEGLMGLVGAERAQSDGQTPSVGLSRARRLVLERLLVKGPEPRLLMLLADLAQEDGDYGSQIRALEETLPAAGDQRASQLRQLIALVSGREANAPSSGGPVRGDAVRKADFGRRLLALRTHQPPEVYADLARTLLAQQDPSGAYAAFAAMSDIGGLVNVDAARADAQLAIGAFQPALESYRRARVRDRTDLDLVMRTGVLMERLGETDEANRAYWQGVSLLVAQQPRRGLASSEDSSLALKRYWRPFVEGLLLTWPEDDAVLRSRVEALFRDARSGLRTGGGAVVDWPRYRLMLDLVHRVAEFRGDASWSRAADAEARAIFPTDAVLERDIELSADLGGYGEAVDGSAADDWVMTGLKRQAATMEAYALRLALTIREGRSDELRALVQEAFAADRADRARAESPSMQRGSLYLLLTKAVEMLSPSDYRADVLIPAFEEPGFSEAAFDLLRTQPERYEQIEQIAGRRLLTSAQLEAFLSAGLARPLTQAAVALRSEGRPATLEDMIDQLQRADQLRLYGALLANVGPGRSEPGLLEPLARALLRERLGSADRLRLSELLMQDVQTDRDDEDAGLVSVRKLLVLDMDAGNRPGAIAAARVLAERQPEAGPLADLLSAQFEGRNDLAFSAYRSLYTAYGETFPINLAREVIAGRYEAEVGRQAETFLHAERPTQADVAGFHAFYVRGARRGALVVSPRDRERYLARLVALRPDNGLYLAEWLEATGGGTDDGAMLERLAPYLERRPEAELAEILYQLSAYRLGDQTALAASVARGGFDLRTAEGRTHILNRLSGPNESAAFAPLVSNILDSLRRRAGDPVGAALASGEGDRNPLSLTRPDDLGRLLAEGSPEAARGALRSAWRNAGTANEEGIQDPAGRRGLTRALGAINAKSWADPERRRLIGDEVEAYLAASEPGVRVGLTPLYDWRARELDAQGLARARLDELLHRSDHGSRVHDIEMIVALALATTDGLSPGEIERLTRDLKALPVLTAGQRLRIAEVFALAGQPVAAEEMAKAALLQIEYRSDLEFDAAARVDAAQVEQSLERWPDKGAAERVRAALPAAKARAAGL